MVPPPTLHTWTGQSEVLQLDLIATQIFNYLSEIKCRGTSVAVRKNEATRAEEMQQRHSSTNQGYLSDALHSLNSSCSSPWYGACWLPASLLRPVTADAPLWGRTPDLGRTPDEGRLAGL